MIDHLPDRLDLYAMAEAGRELHGRMALADLPRVLPLLESDAGELDVVLELGRDEDGTHTLCGSVKGNLELRCQRCLEPVTYGLDTQFRLALVFSQEAAGEVPDRYEPLLITREPTSLVEVVSEEVLLALPIVAVHDETSECHALANEYAPAVAKRENPFAVLARLKEK